MAIFFAPQANEEKSAEKFIVEPGPYICDKCNKQVIHKAINEPLKPCKYCGSYTFWR